MQQKIKFIKTILTTCILCHGIRLNAQQSQLYGIAGKNYEICQSTPFPTQLLTIENNSFKVIKDFIKVDSNYDSDMKIDDDSTDRPLKIGIYHNLKFAVVFTRDTHKEKFYFYVINFAGGLKIDTLCREFPEDCITKPNFYIVDINNTPFIIFKQIPGFFKKDHTEVFRGINLRTYQDTVFTTNEVIKNLHSEGEQGIALNGSTSDVSEVMKLKTIAVNSQIVNPISYPCLADKELGLFDMPEREQFFSLDPSQKIVQQSPNEYFPLLIVNNQFIVYRNNHRQDIENGGQTYSVYNAEKKQWHETPYFKGFSLAGTREFNNWIAGHVSFEYQWGYEQKIKKYGAIPGKQYRKQTCKFGFTFDKRINLFKQFPLGTLYLYNMETYKYIEWDALENGEHQGDSEIILVQDDTVYYRINDMIYKASVINGEKLGKSELLIKDSRVPDIHWAFLSKN
jgi:hypothetical protein